MRKLTYYAGMTIDGFIAGPGDEIDFLPVTDDVMTFIAEEYPETVASRVRAQLGVDAGNRHFDVGIQGRVTHEPALRIGVTSPYTHLRQYVVSAPSPVAPIRPYRSSRTIRSP
ncbi:MAG: hypothetical protein ACRDT0_09145 [Pseudonocardiaceae bacterium]